MLRDCNNNAYRSASLGTDGVVGLRRTILPITEEKSRAPARHDGWHLKCRSRARPEMHQSEQLRKRCSGDAAPLRPRCFRYPDHPKARKMTQPPLRSPASARVNVVVPVYNKLPLLDQAIGSIVAAAEAHGATDIRLVDNGSTDGSFEFLRSRFSDKASVLRLSPATIGGVRNFGARASTAGIVSFLDCDCLVPSDFFTILEEVFERTGAAAAGRRIVLPPNPTWVESAWDQMHQDGLDGERTWINSANLAVRRRVFEAVGGFDESLETGEDAELCQRIRAAGGRIIQDQRLAVAHLDNSKTLPAFYRKERWRGLGMFGTVSVSALDKPTAMTVLHLLLLCIAAATIAITPFRWEWSVVLAVTLILVTPVVTVVYRKRSSIHRFNVIHATVLYELYFLARINAIFIVLFRRARNSRAAT